jgi:hypothetical protein
MKKYLLPLLPLLYFSVSHANNPDTLRPPSLAEAQEWISSANYGFTENRGQIRGKNGEPVKEILFKAAAPGIDIYLTTTGITYVFSRIEKKKKSLLEKLKEKLLPRLVRNPEEEADMKGLCTMEGMALVGASVKKENIEMERPVGNGFYSNFYSALYTEGILEVKTYEKITVRNVYPGIDWVIHCTNDSAGVKYDFIVHPGADPDDIRLRYFGPKANKIEVSASSVKIRTALGVLTEGKLLCYQENKIPVGSEYQVVSANSSLSEVFVKFKIGKYDPAKTLTIDPPLYWATYYGGTGIEGARSITVDGNNNVYIVGYTISQDFPLDSVPGAYYNDGANLIDLTLTDGPAFIVKFNKNGVRLWATFFPGSLNAAANDAAGNLYIGGINQPSNQNILSPSRMIPLVNSGGGAYFQNYVGLQDAFFAKFSPAGVLVHSSYFGGTQMDALTSIHADVNNNVYLLGNTYSNDIPLSNAGGGCFFQGSHSGGTDLFVVKLSPALGLLWSTYFGGNGGETPKGIVTDKNGNLYLTGETTSTTNFPLRAPASPLAFYQGSNNGGTDLMIAKFNASGVLKWSTYCGGAGNESSSALGYDNIRLAVNSHDDLYVVGSSSSADFPVKDPGSCAYFQGTLPAMSQGSAVIMRFDSTSELKWSTYYSDIGAFESAFAIAVDHDDNVFVLGSTTSGSLPLMNPNNGSYYQGIPGGGADMFLLEFNPENAMIWGTYYGSNSTEFPSGAAVTSDNCLFVTGEWGIYVPGITYTQNPGGGAYYQFMNNPQGVDETFIMRFNPTPPVLMTLQANVNHVSCNGGSNGSATATAAGGIGAYSYTWNTSPAQFTQTATNLKAGTYIVTVTDQICTQVTASVTITEPAPITISTSVVNALVCSQPSGSATANPTGGTPNYTYLWQTIPPQPWQTAVNLMQGTYSVTVTDSRGCTASVSATVSCGSVVPVTLLNFTAEPGENYVTLRWRTASESSCGYFTIERGSTEDDFRELGTVRCTGNSSSMKHYSFDDLTPLTGLAYYRLKETDAQGNTGNKAVISVNTPTQTGLRSISPNPLGSERQLSLQYYSAKKEVLQVSVTDLLGRQILSQNHACQAGENILVLDLSSLPRKQYIIEIKSETAAERKKIVISE